MKRLVHFSLLFTLIAMVLSACKIHNQPVSPDPEIVKKVDAYASFPLTTDLSGLTAREKSIIPLLVKVSEIIDGIFWLETYGDKEELFKSITDPAQKRYAEINYGPWDRLDEDKPFIPGAGIKPPGAQFYPSDMTKEEYEGLDVPGKSSLYTVIRRSKEGGLTVIPYRQYFSEQVNQIAGLLDSAAALADDPGLNNYLIKRAQAMRTDDYFDSDMAWMDMKSSRIDFVVGPIENYEDALYGYKAAHEAFVLIKDMEWSDKLARFAQLLPVLQKSLPVPDAYKTEVPGSSSDLSVYDAVFFAGDCNSGSKTIAINLPNDERVQIQKGSRKLQLKNAIKAKFEKILVPVSEEVIVPEQRKNVVFDAFFENIMFHEVSHALGAKNTINGKGSVRKALSEQYSAIEEAKADIAGLFVITRLAAMGELGTKDLMDNYVTFLAGIFRSVRFGATNAHGKANMLQFNYFNEQGAFTRDEATGFYSVNFEKMQATVNNLGNLIITLEGDGNYEGVKELMAQKGVVPDVLQQDLDRINQKGIPKDIVFEQGLSVLGL